MRKWEWVAEDIRARILSGEFPEGSRLPTGPALMREYEVGGPTIHKARVFLREKGLIRTDYDNGSHISSRRCTVIYNKEQTVSKQIQIFTNDTMTCEDSNEFVWAGYLIDGVMHWVENWDVLAEEDEYFPGHIPLIVCTASEFDEKPTPEIIAPVRS
ncbi:GntR family transcriptional regulator [Streptomyces mutabilis]|uniref:GntR family transcriptional regulator n=1 Tax=Streptomyces mutabilis TaxID=67332 RepID=UPI00341F45B6